MRRKLSILLLSSILACFSACSKGLYQHPTEFDSFDDEVAYFSAFFDTPEEQNGIQVLKDALPVSDEIAKQIIRAFTLEGVLEIKRAKVIKLSKLAQSIEGLRLTEDDLVVRLWDANNNTYRIFISNNSWWSG